MIRAHPKYISSFYCLQNLKVEHYPCQPQVNGTYWSEIVGILEIWTSFLELLRKKVYFI